MTDSNSEEMYDDYYDMESELERQEVPEHISRIWREMATSILSRAQLKDKGNLLGCFKSGGFLNTYIEIFENAFIGKVESARSKELVDIHCGYIALTRANVERGVLYLSMYDRQIYRLRHMKLAEVIAYRMNEQKRKSEEDKLNEN